jgi:hypothetical protein
MNCISRNVDLHEAEGRATLSSARRATHWNAETVVGKQRWRDEDIAPYHRSVIHGLCARNFISRDSF